MRERPEEFEAQMTTWDERVKREHEELRKRQDTGLVWGVALAGTPGDP
jgi:hypothetical protein